MLQKDPSSELILLSSQKSKPYYNAMFCVFKVQCPRRILPVVNKVSD